MNEEQSAVLKIAESGHNLFLTGQAGTGKTFTLCKIVSSLQISDRNVVVTASTGKAASVLKEKIDTCAVTTIHRFSGILDGRYSNEELVNLMVGSEVYETHRCNIINTDTLIIDEISMISSKTFTQLEYIFRNIRKNDKLFGGIQMIVAGDLRQLPPVPNEEYDDDGSFFIAANFINSFHVVQLHTVQRQEEEDLIQAINEVASGSISVETDNLLRRLKRTLPPGEEPVKLFSLNFDVDVCNARLLGDLEAEEHVYTAIEEGDVKGCSGEKELHLKERCPVMLIVNLSDELVNGLTGKVTKVTEKNINVFFATLKREVNVQKFSFTKYSAKLKRDVGCRMQFPLKLAYASTIHKAQGMTLDRVSLDCKKMFQYGQLAVGLSRARLKKGLQVLNFSKLLLKPPPPLITDFLQREPLPVEVDFSCCMGTKNLVSGKSLQSYTCCVSNVDSTEDFDSDIEQEIIEKVSVIEQELSRDKTEIKYPLPEDFVEKTLQNLLFQDPETEQQKLQNFALSALQDSIADTKSYIQYVWEKFNGLIESANLNSQDITNKNLSNLYKLINKELTSEENKLRVSSLFGHNPSENEFNLIYRITSTVRKEVLRLAANPIVQEALKQAEEDKGKTFHNSPAGVGKIRYIAGWCLFKLMKKRKKGIISSMYNRSKVHITEKLIREKEIIEHLEISQLHESKDQESLQEIERKQNIRRGLTHVSDKCADFFVELDVKVQKLQTSVNLNIHGSKFPNFIKNVLRNDKDLKSKWTHLFLEFRKEVSSDILESVFGEILDRYTLMSIAQLRKEYLEKKHTRKLEATRKQIKMRTEGKKSNPCTIETIKNDTSSKKTASHRRLQSELLSNVTFLETNFKKTELNVLCLAYNMKGFRSVSTKKGVAEMLRPVILSNDSVLNFEAFFEVQVSSTSAQQHVAETNPLSESVDHLEEEQPEQVSEITNQSGSTSDREEEGGQSKCKQSSKRRNTTCKSRKRKSMGTKKGKGKKRKGPVKWPCGICTKDASSDSVGCDRCDTWYHADCLKLDDLENLGDPWYCQPCIADIENESDE